MGVDKRSGLTTVLTDDLRERFYADGWWSEGGAADLVDRWATTRPDRLAVRDDRRSYTWAELRYAALRFPEMIDFLLERKIDKHKLPERLEVRAELPKTPAGKIRKAVLEHEIAGVDR